MFCPLHITVFFPKKLWVFVSSTVKILILISTSLACENIDYDDVIEK